MASIEYGVGQFQVASAGAIPDFSAMRRPHLTVISQGMEVTTNGDDVASHDDGLDTNRSGDRDPRDGPTHDHDRGHAHGRL